MAKVHTTHGRPTAPAVATTTATSNQGHAVGRRELAARRDLHGGSGMTARRSAVATPTERRPMASAAAAGVAPRASGVPPATATRTQGRPARGLRSTAASSVRRSVDARGVPTTSTAGPVACEGMAPAAADGATAATGRGDTTGTAMATATGRPGPVVTTSHSGRRSVTNGRNH